MSTKARGYRHLPPFILICVCLLGLLSLTGCGEKPKVFTPLKGSNTVEAASDANTRIPLDVQRKRIEKMPIPEAAKKEALAELDRKVANSGVNTPGK